MNLVSIEEGTFLHKAPSSPGCRWTSHQKEQRVFWEAWQSGAGFCQVATAKTTPNLGWVSHLLSFLPTQIRHTPPLSDTKLIQVWSPHILLCVFFFYRKNMKNKENWDMKRATKEGISPLSKQCRRIEIAQWAWSNPKEACQGSWFIFRGKRYSWEHVLHP